jgi:hypothetical protein
MADDTSNSPAGWKQVTDEHGAKHMVRSKPYALGDPPPYVPPATAEISTTTTTPAAAPPTSGSKDDPMPGLFILLVAISLYFLPFITASKRGHRNRGAIGIMNLFLGWTGLGWVGALIWAFTANTETSPR